MSGICDHDPIPSQIDIEELIAAKSPEIPAWVAPERDNLIAAANRLGGNHSVRIGEYEIYAYTQPKRICWGVNGPPHGFNIDRGTAPLSEAINA